jgi:hypothetical protein
MTRQYVHKLAPRGAQALTLPDSGKRSFAVTVGLTAYLYVPTRDSDLKQLVLERYVDDYSSHWN